jgi:threonylcarbamoyladenosine tRNA methylthiotransferase MtaB
VPIPNVVRLVRNEDKDALVDIIANDVDVTTTVRFGEGDGACGSTLTPGVAGRTAMTLRVQTGCEEACSYCIIPQTRGASRFPSAADCRWPHRTGRRGGYKEVAITGVHLVRTAAISMTGHR